MRRLLLSTLLVSLIGCASKPDGEKATKGPPKPVPVVAMAENTTNPLAKHLEVAGVRLTEKPGGKLVVKVAVINHSQADLGDVALELNLPACTLPMKVGSLGPEGVKDVTGECTTKLRVYELPDWQFVKPVFKITNPTE